MIQHEITPDGGLRITVTSDAVDASNAAALKEKCKELASGVKNGVWIDLHAVSFIDSSGIGALLGLLKQVGDQLVIVNPQPSVMSVFELLRLHRVFQIEY